MKKLQFLMLNLVLIIFSHTARGEVLVLVHGWAADASTWQRSGVLPILQSAGWRDSGVVVSSPSGAQLFSSPYPVQSSKHVYRVELPSNGPLLLQASHLISQLAFIQGQHPEEAMTLAGHSSGGVVARLAVIKPEYVKIHSLITIASPNLGTPRALDGLAVVDSKPDFCPGPGIYFLKTVLGGNQYQYLKASRGSMTDLQPAAPGSLLDWLNRQPHPPIRYHAVIRGQGDDLVPAASQDLNQVSAIQGKAHRYLTPSGHALSAADGQLLLDILSN
ncbi:MAG: GPI inositol-deacylase [Gammaproteobacteria bacterium]|nr:GPI inositol-deacylase [Gammaproteobacteria bacterium]